MAAQSNTMTTNQAVQAYSTNKIEGATPGELVLHAYDYVIAQLRKGNMQTSNRGIVELQSSLNLDHLEVAGPLFRIYEYTSDIIRAGNFKDAERIISSLRNAWQQIVDLAETGAIIEDQAKE